MKYNDFHQRVCENGDIAYFVPQSKKYLSLRETNLYIHPFGLNPAFEKLHLHRENEPSLFHKNGDIEYWINNVPYNPNGAAIVRKDGTKVWFNIFGYIHRDNDFPAIEKADGTKEFYKNGVLHRDNKPAIISPNNHLQFYKNGQRHSDNSPAVLYEGKDRYYAMWWKYNKITREDAPAEEDYTFGGSTIIRKVHRYYKNGNLHSTTNAAVEVKYSQSKYMAWYEEGKLHRKENPAIENSNGYLGFALNGNIHTIIDDGGKSHKKINPELLKKLFENSY